MRWLVLVLVALATGFGGADESAKLEQLRERIGRLVGELSELDRQRENVAAERRRLETELELAEARVDELELILSASTDEIRGLEAEIDRMDVDLIRQREVVARHLQMVAMLGAPGPAQLLLDAAEGGELDQAIDTVSLLTRSQAAQLESYRERLEVRRERARRLDGLIASARQEADELLERRRELEGVRQRVAAELGRLDRQRRRTRTRLEEMQQRAGALERLLAMLGTRDRSRRLPGGVRELQGGLRWPVEGAEVVLEFGPHRGGRYATQTVCNGLRLGVEPGIEARAVYPGVVAFARHFKGYGNMVIVDHGDGVFSVTASLASIHTRVDARSTWATSSASPRRATRRAISTSRSARTARRSIRPAGCSCAERGRLSPRELQSWVGS